MLVIRAHFRYPKALLTLEHSLELMHDVTHCDSVMHAVIHTVMYAVTHTVMHVVIHTIMLLGCMHIGIMLHPSSCQWQVSNLCNRQTA